MFVLNRSLRKFITDFKIIHRSFNNSAITQNRNFPAIKFSEKIPNEESDLSTRMVPKEAHHAFMSVFPDIVKDLTGNDRFNDIQDATKRFANILEYVEPNGKKQRALTLIVTYKMLEKQENLTLDNLRLMNILGWCIEMLQGFYLVVDDIVDQSETRRGRLCWHKMEGIGLSAINDSVLLECGVYLTLKDYFSFHPNYLSMINLFRNVTLKTAMGQLLDNLCSNNGKPNYNMFTMETYKTITKYKCVYSTFYLPIGLAMELAQFAHADLQKQTKAILLEMGQFFQAQDDYLDCYGNIEKTGKFGTDIKMGKCSWLAVKALERSNAFQKQLMENHYGQDNIESINIVRNLYKDLNLDKIYKKYEKESYNNIQFGIKQISNKAVQDLLNKLMEINYRRQS